MSDDVSWILILGYVVAMVIVYLGFHQLAKLVAKQEQSTRNGHLVEMRRAVREMELS